MPRCVLLETPSNRGQDYILRNNENDDQMIQSIVSDASPAIEILDAPFEID